MRMFTVWCLYTQGVELQISEVCFLSQPAEGVRAQLLSFNTALHFTEVFLHLHTQTSSAHYIFVSVSKSESNKITPDSSLLRTSPLNSIYLRESKCFFCLSGQCLSEEVHVPHYATWLITITPTFTNHNYILTEQQNLKHLHEQQWHQNHQHLHHHHHWQDHHHQNITTNRPISTTTTSI